MQVSVAAPQEVLAGPVPVGLGDVERPNAAVVVPGEHPDRGGQGRDKEGCREGIVQLKECDRLYVPPRLC